MALITHGVESKVNSTLNTRGVSTADVDGIYVLSNGQSLFIKRVTRRLNGQHEITSDNPLVRQTDQLNGDHPVQVLGRVVWLWNGRKA